MSKIFNWFFGSFFRTLGRIFVFILLGYLFFSFINISDIKLPNLFNVLDVSADVLINDLQVPTSHYLYTGNQGNYRLKFEDDNLYDDISLTPNYFLITMCSTADNVSSWYSNFNQGDSNEITFYTTDIPCKFTDVDYKGKILYVYGSSLSCSVQGTNCSVYGDYTFYQVGSASYSLLGFQTSFDAISIDFSSGSVISQNQEIINQNQQIINGQNNIINNQNNNTDKVIDNQNQNTDKEIESQLVCKDYDVNSIILDGALNTNGQILNDNTFGITNYININKATIKLLNSYNSSTYNYCFYNVNKTLISCHTIHEESNVIIPDNAYYFRGSISKQANRPTYRICQNGNQAIGDSLNDLNNDINNSDSTGASNNATDFFNNFTTDTHGLTGIITAPLFAIQSLAGATCLPLELPLPFVNKTLPLPCMREIYDEFFGDFMTIYDVVTLGIVSYWVLIRIFSLVKDFKNPEHDELEVLDL